MLREILLIVLAFSCGVLIAKLEKQVKNYKSGYNDNSKCKGDCIHCLICNEDCIWYDNCYSECYLDDEEEEELEDENDDELDEEELEE